MEYINQRQMILDYISLHGSITVTDASRDLGIYGGSLSTRISELKRLGHPISTKTEKGKNRYGKNTQHKRYYLQSEDNNG